MKYDYTFFEEHAKRKLILKHPHVYSEVNTPLHYLYPGESKEYFEILHRNPDPFDLDAPDVVRCNGAYFKGGVSLGALQERLKYKLPGDFLQFYERFGECAIYTRSQPIWIYPMETLMRELESDPHISVEEGNHFRFASYYWSYYLGLKRKEGTDEWQITFSDYGFRHDEERSRHAVHALTFHAWLKRLIETDGFPDDIYPYLYGEEDDLYLQIANKWPEQG